MSDQNLLPDGIPVVADQLYWVPPGNYELFFSCWETRWRYGWGPKAYLWFLIASGTYQCTPLCRHYNVKELLGKPGPGGLFLVGSKSAYFREFVDCHGSPESRDLLPYPDRYSEGIVLGAVKTVDRDESGRPLHEAAQYSVIESLRPLRGKGPNND